MNVYVSASSSLCLLFITCLHVGIHHFCIIHHCSCPCPCLLFPPPFHSSVCLALFSLSPPTGGMREMSIVGDRTCVSLWLKEHVSAWLTHVNPQYYKAVDTVVHASPSLNIQSDSGYYTETVKCNCTQPRERSLNLLYVATTRGSYSTGVFLSTLLLIFPCLFSFEALISLSSCLLFVCILYVREGNRGELNKV